VFPAFERGEAGGRAAIRPRRGRAGRAARARSAGARGFLSRRAARQDDGEEERATAEWIGWGLLALGAFGLIAAIIDQKDQTLRLGAAGFLMGVGGALLWLTSLFN